MEKLFRIILLLNFSILPPATFAQATGGSVTQTLTNDGASPSPLAKCLPAGIKLSDIAEATSAGYANGQPVGPNKITVEQKLNELKATCNSENKLVDGNGKLIVFYHLAGCWGNPPPDYQEILQKQRGEINRLKQQYTVIEITCNPSGVHISLADVMNALPDECCARAHYRPQTRAARSVFAAAQWTHRLNRYDC